MEIKKEDCQEVETSNNLITTLKLGTTQGSGAHQMQASWACGLKGVDRFKKARGAYVTMVKQDCKRLAETHSFQGAKIFFLNVQGKL